MVRESKTPFVVIACGGTGGHLFPGLAIAEELQSRGCEIALLVSSKEVDQQGVKSAVGMQVVTLPAVASGRGLPSFLGGGWRAFQVCRRLFSGRRPDAVLAMGGFTSAPPILAAQFPRVPTFLHEANAIPGRANRLLGPLADRIFVGFPGANEWFSKGKARCIGTPVRSGFTRADPEPCRMALGLEPSRPVLLVMGGSQGAAGINELLIDSLPLLKVRAGDWQILHLTGPGDFERTRAGYGRHQVRAKVVPYLTEMELALGSATVAVNRAGASSLAEMAAVGVPSVLIPYPRAADNHQYHNARAYMLSGAARQLDQGSATPEMLVRLILELGREGLERDRMLHALERWKFPRAAEEIVDCMLSLMQARSRFQLASHEPARDRSGEGWVVPAVRIDRARRALGETEFRPTKPS